ncbi:type II toxin-antitoxin system death-on-curing family toxin [Candidatus Poribacteria bacterium]|nr:MAG: type II toxin-antitoxin system death-on-curing family toxin [Candidatus Poribacteria bacterium]
MIHLTIEDILIIAETHVENHQLLHKDQLDYLVEAISAKFGDTELYPTPFQKAAVYAHHIITGHIFFDGNKRIGLTCALLFLELNGYSRLSNIDDSIIELGFKIADGTITDIEVIADHIQSWVL